MDLCWNYDGTKAPGSSRTEHVPTQLCGNSNSQKGDLVCTQEIVPRGSIQRQLTSVWRNCEARKDETTCLGTLCRLAAIPAGRATSTQILYTCYGFCLVRCTMRFWYVDPLGILQSKHSSNGRPNWFWAVGRFAAEQLTSRSLELAATVTCTSSARRQARMGMYATANVELFFVFLRFPSCVAPRRDELLTLQGLLSQ